MITIKVKDTAVRYCNGEYIIDVNKIIDVIIEQNGTQLKNIQIGKTFKIGGEEWIVLEQSGDTTACLRKDLLSEKIKFDDTTNNFSKSYINHFLNVHYKEKLQKLVGNYLCEHTVDLTADDGLRDYKKCKAYVSLLTCEQYRKYTDIMLKYNPEKWWWLATAYSTPTRGYNRLIRYVNYSGSLNNYYCNDCGGVRPFIVLKNTLEVDEV